MGSQVHILVLSTSLLSGMKSLKMKLILFLAVAGFIEAGPQLNGIMKDVNATPEGNSSLVVNSAPPEEDLTPEDDHATEEFSSGGTGDLSKSRSRRGDIDTECYATCLETKHLRHHPSDDHLHSNCEKWCKM